jgi:MOSC domain-containing protein YiiM
MTEVETVKQQATVKKLMVLPPQAKIRSKAVDRVQVTEAGFEGDRHAGLTRPAGARDGNVAKGTIIRNTRQVSLVAQEDLEQIAQSLGVPEVDPQWLGANISLEGVGGLNRFSHGTRLRFDGGVVLVIETENSPCRTPGEILAEEYPDQENLAARFAKEALGLRGLVGWVDQPGVIEVGEEVVIDLPA